MSQPTPYSRQFDFTGWSTSRPNTPLPGVQVDAELNAVKEALNHALINLALLQRADTGLANGVVGVDQLDSVVQAIIAGSGFTVKGDWAASTAYVPGDLVANDGKIYLVLETHNSSVSLAADIASGYVSVALFAPHALLDFEAELASVAGAALIGTTTASNTVQSLLDSIRAAIGIAGAASHMGTYTGLTVPDNETAKQNIQSLETAVELRTPRFADRTALAAVSTTLAAVYDVAYLWESGREGMFVWSAADNSANVTIDTEQAVYIPPASDATGASGAWVRKFNGPTYLKWFGGLDDGATDNKDTIVAAVEYAKDLCPSGTLLDGFFKTSASVTLDFYSTLLSGGPRRRGGTADTDGPGLWTDAATGVHIICDQTTTQGFFSNMRLVATAATALTAIKASRSPNTDDVDCYFEGIAFNDYNTCIEVVGRGCYVKDCLFVSPDVSIRRSWPTSGVVSSGTDWQDLPNGFRADRIADCRQHGGAGTFLIVEGTDRGYYRGFLSNIQIDIGGRLFEGAFSSLIVDNCQVRHAGTTIFYFDAACEGLEINGGFYGGTLDTAASSPSHALWATSDLNKSSIQAHFAHSDNELLRFDGDCDGLRLDVVLENYGDEGDEDSAILLNGGTYNALDFTLTCIEGSGSLNPVNCSGSPTITNSTIKGTWRHTEGEIIRGAWIDGGGNDFDYTQDKSEANELDNGDFQVAQRGLSFASGVCTDTAFLVDRWRLLSDGDGAVSLVRNSGSGITFTVATANKKFGILQMLPFARSKDFIDKALAWQVVASKGAGNATLDTIKIALVAWTGATDAPDADPISAWGAEGADPTLKTNWSYVVTPRSLGALTSGGATYREHGTPTAGVNLGVLIWCDNGDSTVGDTLTLESVQLEKGLCCTAFKARSFEEELQRCQFYFERINADNDDRVAAGFNYSTTQAILVLPYLAKRTQPSLSFSTATNWSLTHAGATTALTSFGTSTPSTDYSSQAGLTANVAAGLTAGGGCVLRPNTANQTIDISAEI